MDTPEPDPSTSQTLHNQYILLLNKSGFSNEEAEIITKVHFEKYNNLRMLNPDKLSRIIRTTKLTDENIYIYMISLVKKEKISDKIINFQKLI